MRIVLNSNAEPQSAAYAGEAAAALSPDIFLAADAEISRWPGYAPTPLHDLAGLAAKLGIARLHYKDEATRFGLGSFKPLGGAYAVARVLARALARRGIAQSASTDDLLSGRYRDAVADITITSATDGNHGRAVAWGARLFGCRAVIFIHEHVSEGRRTAIESYGATVVRVPGSYDDSVRHAFRESAKHGWHVVQDTAIGDYRAVPSDITAGYGVLAGEAIRQLTAPPTHVFVQVGVGGLAAAVCARFWIEYDQKRPRFITLEPSQADCVAQSISAGESVEVTGNIDSLMAGLSCGVVSELAWDVLRPGTFAAMTIDDASAVVGMRQLAYPELGDPAIVAGECAGGAIGALLALAASSDALQQLGISANSRILVIGTEGATDPEIYTRLIGRSPAATA